MINKTKKITPKLFFKTLSTKPNVFLEKRIEAANLEYSEIDNKERDYWIRKMVSVLIDDYVVYSGEHRHEQWEKGWEENLIELLQQNNNKDFFKAILPKYFNKYPIVRFNHKLVKSESDDFEFKILGLVLDWLFDQYVRNVDAIYEFGCGTGYNLFRVREFNSTAELWGLDWASSSQKIIERIRLGGIDKNMFGHKFDYFNPDNSFKLINNSVVFTVASLEQIGDKYTAFVDYLLKNKPKLCIHVEPIAELLNHDDLLDFLSIEYFKKRKYLSGFLTYLKKLEQLKKIEILRAQRSYTGSLFIEGHSVIVWAPKY